MALIPKKRKLLKFCLRLFGLISIVAAVLVFTTEMNFETADFVESGSAGLAEMNDSDIYKISDISVIDLYATYKDKKESSFYLITVRDNDGTQKYASLIADAEDGELFKELASYIGSTDRKLGDCVLNGYFSVKSLEKLDYSDEDKSRLKECFYEFVSNYQQKINVEPTNLLLDFEFASKEGFSDYNKGVLKEIYKWAAIAALFAVSGIIFISFALSMSRKDKRLIKENLVNNGVYFNPVQENNGISEIEYENMKG